jgi:hypothetical protein
MEATVERVIEGLLDAPRSQPVVTVGNQAGAVADRDDTRGPDGFNVRSKGSARAEIAALLISEVPSFPFAGVDEILDLRQRVQPVVERFRGAVAQLYDDEAQDLDDDAFIAFVEEVRVKNVNPELEELRETLRDNGAIVTAARGVPAVAGGALGLGAAVALGAPDLAGVVSLASGVATATTKELVGRHQRAGQQRKHQFFLLFDIEQQLKRVD